jgi:hypothetical protein
LVQASVAGFWRGTRRLVRPSFTSPPLKLAPAQDADVVATPGLVHPSPSCPSSRQKHEKLRAPAQLPSRINRLPVRSRLSLTAAVRSFILAKSSPLSQSPDIVPRVWPSNTQCNPYHPKRPPWCFEKTRPPIWKTCSTALHHQRLAVHRQPQAIPTQ